jgi:deazaflavin-dependent oxidoreductase (nitroreductase family)
MAEMYGFDTKVVQEFRANGGKVVALAHGRPFEGVPMLLLHHCGAKTGVERVNPLVYQKVGDSYAVFATKGGAPTHPGWYRNLMANPHTQVEVGTAILDVTARELEGHERNEVWQRQKILTPVFADYEEKTKNIRHIPVVLLERRS